MTTRLRLGNAFGTGQFALECHEIDALLSGRTGQAICSGLMARYAFAKQIGNEDPNAAAILSDPRCIKYCLDTFDKADFSLKELSKVTLARHDLSYLGKRSVRK